MPEKTKRCRTCHRTKPVRLFYKRSANKDGYTVSCKSCMVKTPAGQKERDRYLRTRYGITLQEYEKQLSKQGGCCYICRGGTSKRNFAVDHDHKTGEPRGLLCGTCNNVLGKFRDDPTRFRRAATYLTTIPFRKVLGERDWSGYADENNIKKPRRRSSSRRRN